MRLKILTVCTYTETPNLVIIFSSFVEGQAAELEGDISYMSPTRQQVTELQFRCDICEEISLHSYLSLRALY